jgi:hypothetical protein
MSLSVWVSILPYNYFYYLFYLVYVAQYSYSTILTYTTQPNVTKRLQTVSYIYWAQSKNTIGPRWSLLLRQELQKDSVRISVLRYKKLNVTRPSHNSCQSKKEHIGPIPIHDWAQ